MSYPDSLVVMFQVPYQLDGAALGGGALPAPQAMA